MAPWSDGAVTAAAADDTLGGGPLPGRRRGSERGTLAVEMRVGRRPDSRMAIGAALAVVIVALALAGGEGSLSVPKAIVLVHRINSFWGLNWQGMQAHIQQITMGSEIDVVIGCVDTRKARCAIDAAVRKSRVLYWLDLGNSTSSGQFALGQPNNALNRKKKDRLPTVAELYPEILAPDDKHDQQPACSAAEALTRQAPFINQNLAYQALAMLTQLLRRGSLSFHGGFCNLETGHLIPLLHRGATRHRARRARF